MIPNLIVPTLNRYDLLQEMVLSIDFPIRHLLIIDNGGELGEIDIPARVEKTTILRMPSNLGVAGSWNLGIKSFPHDPVWFIASDDVTFEPGTLEDWFGMSSSGRMIISDEWPHFQFFSIGEAWVGVVGLFDEAIYPANFEDDEYRWRAGCLGFEMLEADLPHQHTQQGTVFHSDFKDKNAKTYLLNESYFVCKRLDKDLSDGFWSLARRRINSWE